MNRGDIVILDFPFLDQLRAKRRPAVVVQHDRDNQRLQNTVVAMISGNIRLSGEPTQVLIDPAVPDGVSSGLHGVSVVKCNNLYTLPQQNVHRIVGHLSARLLTELDNALRAALDLA